jgi:hypothetical protein
MSYVPGVLLPTRDVPNVQVNRVRVSYRSHLVAPISHDRDERPAPGTVGGWLTFQPARNPRLMAARRADARNRAFR